MAQKKRFTRKPRLLILPLVKKKKKRPSNPAVARNIWAQLWPVCVWQFERTHLQIPGGLPGRGGGEGRVC